MNFIIFVIIMCCVILNQHMSAVETRKIDVEKEKRRYSSAKAENPEVCFEDKVYSSIGKRQVFTGVISIVALSACMLFNPMPFYDFTANVLTHGLNFVVIMSLFGYILEGGVMWSLADEPETSVEGETVE